MRLVCSVCGLPKDLCVCGTISSEQVALKVRLEMRRWSKPTTLVEGIDSKDHDLRAMAKKLKKWCACGGSAKDGVIVLQGDHRERMPDLLERLGFLRDNVEVL